MSIFYVVLSTCCVILPICFGLVYLFQGCQLSQVIRETSDFEVFLPVSSLESEISQIIAKVFHFL